jgi:predicted PurR-regulated permease PerM
MKKKRKMVGYFVIAAIIFILFYRYPIVETGLKILGLLLNAAFFAYLLDTLVRIPMAKLKWGRKGSVVFTLGLLALAIILFVTFVVPGLSESFQSLSDLFSGNRLAEVNAEARDWIGRLGIPLVDSAVLAIQTSFETLMSEAGFFSGESLSQGFSTLMNFTSSIATLMIALVLGLYMLGDKEELTSTFDRWSDSFMEADRKAFWLRALRKADDCFVQYFVGKLLASMVMGVLVGLTLFIFKVPYPAVIGMLAGIGNMIPYIGSLLSGLLAIAITLSFGIREVVIVVIAILAAQQVDGLVLSPLILSDRVGVRPVWVLAAVTIGGYVAGLLGIFLAVPAAVFFKWLVDEEAKRRRTLRSEYAEEVLDENHQEGNTEGKA